MIKKLVYIFLTLTIVCNVLKIEITPFYIFSMFSTPNEINYEGQLVSPDHNDYGILKKQLYLNQVNHTEHWTENIILERNGVLKEEVKDVIQSNRNKNTSLWVNTYLNAPLEKIKE